jgi:hypothetical protein
MTSIILSNRVNERNNMGIDDSIYKAWNFKNQLSSNIIIPPNSQIALQSCKINIDGTYSLNPKGDMFSQWFGQVLSDTISEYQTTSAPVQTALNIGVPQGTDFSVNTETLGQVIQNALNVSSHHPNHMGYWTVERKINSTTNEFEGFTYKLDEYNGTTDNKSTYASSNFSQNQMVNNTPATNWTYGIDAGTNNGQFRATSHKNYPAVAILPELPMSLIQGELIVDFSDANGKDVNWVVGLSRSNLVNKIKTGFPNRPSSPKYWSKQRGGDWEFDFFCDYAVYRYADTLYLSHAIMKQDETAGYVGGNRLGIFNKDLDYGNTGDVASLYDIGTNADAYTKVKFTLFNEQIKIELLTATNVATTLYLYKDVGVDGRTKYQNLKPISQANRCLHPVLYVQTTPATADAGLDVEKCICSPIGSNGNIFNNTVLDGYNAVGNRQDGLFSGWWETARNKGFQNMAWALEQRQWNDYSVANTSTHNYLGLQNGNSNLDGSPVLIVKPSSRYEPSGNNNTANLFGFKNTGIIDIFALGSVPDATKFVANSTTTPTLVNTRALFVRLNNLPTKNINGFKGNNTTILSMLSLPSSQGEIGRLFYEPKNLMYVDLLNEQEIRLNSFDVSFCYVDEVFATNLSGQSVVVLHIRQKEHK